MTETFPKLSTTFIVNQLTGLIDNGHDVQVYGTQPGENFHHDVIDEYNLQDKVSYYTKPRSYPEGFKLLVTSIPELLIGGVSPSRIFSTCRHGKYMPEELSIMRNVLRHRDGTDVFHAHFGPVGNRFLSSQPLMESPLIVSFYGRDASVVPRSNPRVYDTLFEKVDALTCLSEDMRGDLTDIGAPPEKIYKVPVCIDTDNFEYKERRLGPDEQLNILTVARFVEKKGLQYAIEAVANLDVDRKISYTIAGDGQRREQLEELIEELDVSDRIELLGWQTMEEITQLMMDAHLFLLPSVTAKNGDKEGTPTVLLEAQAAGLPIVSTTHAGIPEIVDDGDAGILVPERDAMAITDALRELIEHSERWPEMGRAGEKYIETHHSVEVVVDELLDLYQAL
ncbi:glycosyltransferase [Natrinema sp. CBA1119]|uniref:glycosyltransferase n=1 Tax=Natrinema sp. CBA1119 TaxID=1608465 RepID=UPI00159BC2A0|nr:glycosyltransferase [Natrinema sp. CBA1119]